MESYSLMNSSTNLSIFFRCLSYKISGYLKVFFFSIGLHKFSQKEMPCSLSRYSSRKCSKIVKIAKCSWLECSFITLFSGECPLKSSAWNSVRSDFIKITYIIFRAKIEKKTDHIVTTTNDEFDKASIWFAERIPKVISGRAFNGTSETAWDVPRKKVTKIILKWVAEGVSEMQ